MEQLRILYVDGTEVVGGLDRWYDSPSEGVESVQLGDAHLKGHGLYWLLVDAETVVLGAGSLGNAYASRPIEVTFSNGDRPQPRHVRWLPDLHHQDVKLGWWRPGTEPPDRVQEPVTLRATATPSEEVRLLDETPTEPRPGDLFRVYAGEDSGWALACPRCGMTGVMDLPVRIADGAASLPVLTCPDCATTFMVEDGRVRVL